MAIRIYFYVIISGLTSLYSQEISDEKIIVSGRVSDFYGRPVARAILYADSLLTESRTDKQGNYRVTLGKESTTLSVYSHKYGLLTLYYDGRPRADFSYPRETASINKAELKALGFRDELTAEKLTDRENYKNYNTIYEMIQERFSGVVVTGTKIRIRGTSSITDEANSDPLMVVDGTYVTDISFVNPAEVRTIEILKGEDATIYGSRGGNGVILISLTK